MHFFSRWATRCALLTFAAAALASCARADLLITITGTASNPTLTVSETGTDSFSSDGNGQILFAKFPNTFDIDYFQDGPDGSTNPDEIRATAANGGYLNIIALDLGNQAVFTLDSSHPYVTSGPLDYSDVTDLAPLDGVSTTMATYEGTGPTTKVTFDYNIAPAAVTPEPSTWLLMGTGLIPAAWIAIRRREGWGRAAL